MSFPRQGEIHWIDLEPTKGRGQRGIRPALVLSRDEINRLPLTILVLIGTGAEHCSRRYPTDLLVTARESGLPKDTLFLGVHLRAVDPSRLEGRAGQLPSERLPEVFDLVRLIIGDDRPLA